MSQIIIRRRTLERTVVVLLFLVWVATYIQNLGLYLASMQLRQVPFFRYGQPAEVPLLYLKDITIATWSIVWPVLALMWGQQTKSLLFRWCGLLLIAFGIGMLGHVYKFEPDGITAALRYWMWWHGAFGVFVITQNFSRERIRTLSLVAVMLASSAAICGILQAWVAGFGVGLRIPSVFGNAVAFGFALMGAGLLALMHIRSRHTRILIVTLLILGSLASGSRGATCCLLLTLLVATLPRHLLLARLTLSNRFAWLFVFFVGFAVTIAVAPFATGRDSVWSTDIANQKGGRALAIRTSMDRLMKTPGGILAGRGIGVGSNTYFLLNDSDTQLQSDNALVVAIIQWGLIGVTVIAVAQYILLSDAMYWVKVNTPFSILVLATILIGSIVQNAPEQVAFIFSLALVTGCLQAGFEFS